MVLNRHGRACWGEASTALRLPTHSETLCSHTRQGAGALGLGPRVEPRHTAAAAAAAMIGSAPPVLMSTTSLKMRVPCCPPCAPLMEVELTVVVITTCGVSTGGALGGNV